MSGLKRDTHLELLNRVRTVYMDEDNVQFEEILLGLYYELETPTVLSVMLVEQIAQALFWIKRHSKDKELILIEAVCREIDQHVYGYRHKYAQPIDAVKSALERGVHSDAYAEFDQFLREECELGLDDLRAIALSKSLEKVRAADDLINRHVQNIRHLQRSLDSIDFKKRLLRKLDLELERLEKENLGLVHESESVQS